MFRMELPSSFPAALGAVVEEALRSAGLTTRRSAADATGIPLATLHRKITNPASPFNANELNQIALVTGVSVSTLARRAERRSPASDNGTSDVTPSHRQSQDMAAGRSPERTTRRARRAS